MATPKANNRTISRELASSKN